MFAHRELRTFACFLGAAGILAGAPSAAFAQDRQVLAHQVTVAGNEATLRLEFSDGAPLVIALAEGRLRIDGTEAGRFTPGGALDASWRDLLGRVVATQVSGIPGLLSGWNPPPGLTSESLAAAEALAARLDQVFSGATLTDLASGSVRIHVGENVTIPVGETVEGSILLVETDLRLEGTIEGDVILMGGSLDLGADARVGGNVRWSRAEIEGNRNAVGGTIQEVPGLSVAGVEATGGPSVDFDSVEDRIRRQVEAEIARATARRAAPRQSPSALSRVGRGLGGLFQTLISFGILLGLALGLLYFFPRRIEIVARTAREATGRSLLVGMAGIVLALPVWIVGIVLLAVSIIGIPLILLWLPALPLALASAIVVGYLAVAHNLGRWISGHEGSKLTGFSSNSPAANMGMGLVVLLGAFAVANVFEMGGPWFAIFRHVLMAAGGLLGVLAISIGLGAVILSRAGQDSTFAGAAWKLDEEEMGAPSGAAGSV